MYVAFPEQKHYDLVNTKLSFTSPFLKVERTKLRDKMTRVYIIGDTGIPTIDHVPKECNTVKHESDDISEAGNATKADNTFEFSNNEKQSVALVELEEEKENHQRKADQRLEIFERILLNRSAAYSWPKFVAHTVDIIMISCLVSMSYCIIPATNLFVDPSKWYETPLQSTISYLNIAIGQLWLWGHYSNIDYIKTIHNALVLCVVSIVEIFMLYATINYVWTYGYSGRIPFPRTGVLVAYFAMLTRLVIMWYLFPPSWRKISEFRKRLIFVVVLFGFNLNAFIVYLFIIVPLLEQNQNNYQPVFAIMVPVFKEIYAWILSRLIDNTSAGDVNGAKIVGKYGVAMRHTMALCIVIGSTTTESAGSTLMIIDFLTNIYLSLRLVWINKKQHHNIAKQAELLQDLVINEMAEFIGPTTFIVIFYASYFGPNRELLEIVNFLRTYDEFNNYMRAVFNFFLVDLSSVVVTGIILWVFCSINLLKAFAALEKEFVLIFGFITAIQTATVRNIITISSVM